MRQRIGYAEVSTESMRERVANALREVPCRGRKRGLGLVNGLPKNGGCKVPR